MSFGLGMLVSSLVAGPIADYFENDWHLIFLAPVAILVLCTILFLIGFRPMPAVVEGDGGKAAGTRRRIRICSSPRRSRNILDRAGNISPTRQREIQFTPSLAQSS